MVKSTQRRLAAVVSADVVGYSRLMGVDEVGTLAALAARRTDLIDPLVAKFDGRIVKTMGDGLLLEFPSAVDAVEFSFELQRGLAAHNEKIDEDRQIVLRIGVNLGDIIIEGEDIFGDGVNLAARLQEMAEPGAICVAGSVYEQVSGRGDHNFEDLGYRKLKNIGKPVRVLQARVIDAQRGDDTRIGWPHLVAAKERKPIASGGCFCGNVRYELWGEPSAIGYCHCRMCQLALGGPVSAWIACEKRFVKFLGDAPKIYKSSEISERAFCGNCGTSIYTEIKAMSTSDFYSLRLATLDNPEDFPPSCHFGVENQLPWLEINDDLPRIRTEDDPALSACWTKVGQPKGGPTPGTAEERRRTNLKGLLK